MKSRYLGASLLALAVAQAPAIIPASARAQAVPAKAPEEIVVTAQKRSEKLQKVPLSIQVLDSKKLAQLNISNFDDYVKFVPSLSFNKNSGSGPTQNTLYLRGIVDGGYVNHSGPLPTVGSYLDEIPITTIGGALDVHLYDISRIEVLPGPQGTLYGASSEAGTVRIITNKPNPAKFEAGVDIELNHPDNGSVGAIGEGFVNVPLSDKAAVRLVAFHEHDSGWIDNVYGERYLPYTNTTVNNRDLVRNQYNQNDTFGGRAALGVEINDNWSVLAQLMGQEERQEGIYGFDPTVGDLKVQRFVPDSDHDRWGQFGLTVTGHLGDFELTYANGLFIRDTKSQADYTDYTVAYDAAYGSYWTDKNGNALNAPLQYIIGKDHYTKYSNEIRLASPSTDRLRFIVGAFQEQQTHKILQDYQIAGLGELDPTGAQLSIPGRANSWWLTNQRREDLDMAAFAEVSYDILPKLTLTGGLRGYYYDNSLYGWAGIWYFSSFVNACQPGLSYGDAPCVNVNKEAIGRGETHKVNLTYHVDDDRMVYFTYSTGYRPGGNNRRPGQTPYDSDHLINYEIGLKSQWFDHKLTFNTSLYYMDWGQFQFAYLGQNSLTIVKNAPSANIKGMEAAFEVRPTNSFTVSGGVTLTDGALTEDFCTDDAGNVIHDCTNAKPGSLASKGNELPYTPPFKGNLTARYTFPVSDWMAHVQGSFVYQTRAQVALRDSDKAALGSMPAFPTLDLTAGIVRDRTALELFIKNVTNERGEVNRYVSCTIGQCNTVYVVPIQPMTVGLKLSQRF